MGAWYYKYFLSVVMQIYNTNLNYFTKFFFLCIMSINFIITEGIVKKGALHY